MPTLLLSLAIVLLIGAVLLAVCLIQLNQSQQDEYAWVRLFAALFLGVVGFLVTFISALKSSAIEDRWPTFIVEDTRDHLPLLQPRPPDTLTYAFMRHSDVRSMSLAALKDSKPSDPTSSDPAPAINTVDVPQWYLELLQYFIVTTLRDHLDARARSSTKVSLGRRPTASLSPVPRLTRPRVLCGEEALARISSNRFSTTSAEKPIWTFVGRCLTLPEGADLKLASLPAVRGETFPAMSVVVSRAGYFSMTIRFWETVGAGPGSVPEGFEVRPEDLQYSQTHFFVFDASAKFDQLTAGSEYAVESKAWVQAVFAELKNRFSATPMD